MCAPEPSHNVKLKSFFRALHWLYWAISGACLIAAVGARLARVPNVPRLLSAAVGVGALLWVARASIHVMAGYANAGRDEHQRRLRRLFRLSLGVALVWIGDAAVFWFWPSALGQLLVNLVLFVLVALLASVTVEAASEAGRGRGTEKFRELAIVVWLERQCERSGVLRWAARRLSNVTPTQTTSSFVNRLALMLVIVVLADTPAAMVSVYHAVPGTEPTPHGTRMSGSSWNCGGDPRGLTVRR